MVLFWYAWAAISAAVLRAAWLHWAELATSGKVLAIVSVGVMGRLVAAQLLALTFGWP